MKRDGLRKQEIGFSKSTQEVIAVIQVKITKVTARRDGMERKDINLTDSILCLWKSYHGDRVLGSLSQ